MEYSADLDQDMIRGAVERAAFSGLTPTPSPDERVKAAVALRFATEYAVFGVGGEAFGRAWDEYGRGGDRWDDMAAEARADALAEVACIHAGFALSAAYGRFDDDADLAVRIRRRS